jgi:protein arginine N-methyltransferase 1
MLSRMDWNAPLAASRALVLQIGDHGAILARTSLSGRAEPLDRRLLEVLLAFGDGRSPRQAMAAGGGSAGADQVAFAGAVGELIERGALVPAGGGGGAGSPTTAVRGFASASGHYPMIRDTVRVLSYRQAISRHCRDRTVVEIGCGSGLLSILAAKAGARRVVAIEESGIAELAAEMFRVNGVADRIELRRANSRDVELDEPAEVIVHEILGTDPFDEGLLPALADARERLLAPGGRLIPFAVDVWCVGFEVREPPRLDLDRTADDVAELGALYGVDLSPVVRGLAVESERRPPPIGRLDPSRFEPPILTEELELFHVDLRPGPPLALEPRDGLRLRVRRAGRLGGVLVYFRAHLDDDLVLSTSPWAPAHSWGWNARPLERATAVEPGDQVPVRVALRTVRGIEQIQLELT